MLSIESLLLHLIRDLINGVKTIELELHGPCMRIRVCHFLLPDQIGFYKRERHYLLKLGEALTRIGAPLVPNDGPDSLQVSASVVLLIQCIAIVAQN